MHKVEEYLAKAAEFKARAGQTEIDALKKRYTDLGECYLLLAAERMRLIDDGELSPE